MKSRLPWQIFIVDLGTLVSDLDSGDENAAKHRCMAGEAMRRKRSFLAVTKSKSTSTVLVPTHSRGSMTKVISGSKIEAVKMTAKAAVWHDRAASHFLAGEATILPLS